MQKDLQIMQNGAGAGGAVPALQLSTETVVAIKTAMLEKLENTRARMQNALGVRPDEAEFLRRCAQRQANALLEFMRAVKS